MFKRTLCEWDRINATNAASIEKSFEPWITKLTNLTSLSHVYARIIYQVGFDKSKLILFFICTYTRSSTIQCSGTRQKKKQKFYARINTETKCHRNGQKKIKTCLTASSWTGFEEINHNDVSSSHINVPNRLIHVFFFVFYFPFFAMFEYTDFVSPYGL